MDAGHLIAFNLTLIAALISPGPAMLVALRTSLTEGRRAGALVGMGLGMAAALWTLLALLGLSVAFTLFPWAYLALKVLGAGYLLYLAVTIWREARTPLSAAPPRRTGGHVLRGLLVNLGNPKSMLFAASVLVVIFPRDLGMGGALLITLNHLAVEWLAYGAFAAMLSTRPARDGYLSLKPLLDRIAATVLAALGLRLLLQR
ncbi:LysE family translocator [Roseovarius sp. E0-M6]|uniref:LysE family translocator n=1 Tax=Roseovarius sp. E0-M6 TaxID=3127118 RepID=UPI0030100A7D